MHNKKFVPASLLRIYIVFIDVKKLHAASVGVRCIEMFQNTSISAIISMKDNSYHYLPDGSYG